MSLRLTDLKSPEAAPKSVRGHGIDPTESGPGEQLSFALRWPNSMCGLTRGRDVDDGGDVEFKCEMHVVQHREHGSFRWPGTVTPQRLSPLSRGDPAL